MTVRDFKNLFQARHPKYVVLGVGPINESGFYTDSIPDGVKKVVVRYVNEEGAINDENCAINDYS